jgi:hypothetical protein
VYLTAGAAMPSVIETIFLSLMNETFEAAYRLLLKVRHDVRPCLRCPVDMRCFSSA